MEQKAFYQQIGGQDSAEKMVEKLNKWFQEGWNIKLIHTVCSYHHIIILERPENKQIE